MSRDGRLVVGQKRQQRLGRLVECHQDKTLEHLALGLAMPEEALLRRAKALEDRVGVRVRHRPPRPVQPLLDGRRQAPRKVPDLVERQTPRRAELEQLRGREDAVAPRVHNAREHHVGGEGGGAMVARDARRDALEGVAERVLRRMGPPALKGQRLVGPDGAEVLTEEEFTQAREFVCNAVLRVEGRCHHEVARMLLGHGEAARASRRRVRGEACTLGLIVELRQEV
eukprot:scaffold4779_cov116-Isochrysis_galbana.AAC.12